MKTGELITIGKLWNIRIFRFIIIVIILSTWFSKMHNDNNVNDELIIYFDYSLRSA